MKELYKTPAEYERKFHVSPKNISLSEANAQTVFANPQYSRGISGIMEERDRHERKFHACRFRGSLDDLTDEEIQDLDWRECGIWPEEWGRK